MTNEEPLPKKVSMLYNSSLYWASSCLNMSLIDLNQWPKQLLVFLPAGSPQWIWHEDPDQRGVVHKVNNNWRHVGLDVYSSLVELLMLIHRPLLRWKQHEAYVQVLETKYADLCCKYLCCNTIVIQCHTNLVSSCPTAIITYIWLLVEITFLLMHFFFLVLSSLC